MRFWPIKPFKFYEGDKLVAAYEPGLSYRLREGNDRLAVLLNGGKLPGSSSVFIENPDLSQTEIKPGGVAPGWIQEGRVTLVPPANATGGGGVSGAATAG